MVETGPLTERDYYDIMKTNEMHVPLMHVIKCCRRWSGRWWRMGSSIHADYTAKTLVSCSTALDLRWIITIRVRFMIIRPIFAIFSQRFAFFELNISLLTWKFVIVLGFQRKICLTFGCLRSKIVKISGFQVKMCRHFGFQMSKF